MYLRGNSWLSHPLRHWQHHSTHWLRQKECGYLHQRFYHQGRHPSQKPGNLLEVGYRRIHRATRPVFGCLLPRRSRYHIQLSNKCSMYKRVPLHHTSFRKVSYRLLCVSDFLLTSDRIHIRSHMKLNCTTDPQRKSILDQCM